MLDINFEQNLLDLLIFYKSWMGICIYEGPRLDFIAKESVLDGSAYQEVKLDTKLVTSLGRDMLLTLLRFSPSTWVLQPLPYLPPYHCSAGGCLHVLQRTPAVHL